MAKFLLLLHDTNPADFAKLSPNEIQQVIEKYKAWTAKLAKAGKLLASHKLKEEGGKHMTTRAGKLSVVDGPYSEAKEVVGGFYLIEAKDYNEAVDACRDCPHLEFGKIEVREIDPM